jgi:dTDP-4-dehydrorhamnose reductase
MKVWITGATGILGTALQRHFTDRKIPFIATSHADADVADYDGLLNFSTQHKPTHIINCAAYTAVDKAEEDQASAEKINVTGPTNIARAAKKLGARLVHISTDYVFDGTASKPYSEECTCNPIGIYGKTKRAGELATIAEYPSACIVRTSALFGDSGKHFVGTMVKLMCEREELKVVKDQITRPTYAPYLAEIIEHLIEREGIFHATGSDIMSWHTFANLILQHAKSHGLPVVTRMIHPIPSSEYPTPAKRPLFSALSLIKLEEQIPTTRYTMENALNRYFDQI